MGPGLAPDDRRTATAPPADVAASVASASPHLLRWRPMAGRPRPHHSRRAFGRLLVFLLGMTPMGGCDCTSTLPVVPQPLPPLSAVVVSPASDTLRVGQSRQCTAVAYDTLGQPVGGAV